MASTSSSTAAAAAAAAGVSTTTSSTIKEENWLEWDELPSRAALRRARRVCVKAGTSVVANSDGKPSLTRLGAIVEQIAELVNDRGVQVLFVSSGAVGMGKQLLRKQSKMFLSFKDIRNDTTTTSTGSHTAHLNVGGGAAGMMEGPSARTASFANLLNVSEPPHTLAQKKKYYDSACAAAGQFEMMNLYSSLFTQVDVTASQLLVTQADFTDPQRLQNLHYAIERLLSLGIVPIINENDAVSANQGYTAEDVFSDNDSLAALCARHFGAEVLLLLTDVPGVYDRPPSQDNAQLLPLYIAPSSSTTTTATVVQIGEKSAQGRGGMASKIDAALSAVQTGSPCTACVVAAGHDLNSIRAILGPPPPHTTASTATTTTTKPTNPFANTKGTLFCTPGSALEQQALAEWQAMQKVLQKGLLGSSSSSSAVSDLAKAQAIAARKAARTLQALPYSVRQGILNAMADILLEQQDYLLAENEKDVQQAVTDGISMVLQKRLKLTAEKLQTLAAGLRHIASLPDPVGTVKCQREIAVGLELTQVTVPIGVLLVIFESRPDSLPQIAALSIASANGLLLKGGKEAAHSNAALHGLLQQAIVKGSNAAVSPDLIGLVTNRGQVADMLQLDSVIDLVIPRGSNELVSHIKANTRIPVLGHADGVCHVYIDASASATAAKKIVLDAKTDYPSACNAMETLLLHVDTIENGVAASTLMALRAAGVKCWGGPKAMKLGLCDVPAPEPKHEYGDLTCQVEVVDSMDEAIDWIHQYGSGHTEAIVCQTTTTADGDNKNTVAEEFLKRVDAACVFANASTRFADGYRFGLGAEVGISTGRIHARGPVGVEGLLTTKWQLRTTGTGTDANETFCVSDFAGNPPAKTYTHKTLL